MLVAAALRLIPVFFVPSLNYPDEIFQVSEQAHRLVYGTGLVPWEFQLGIRSWILPGLVAALMELARLVGDGPDYYLPLIAGAFVALATAPVVCSFLWCERRFGVVGGVIGGGVVATMPELIYFSGRTLSEVVSAHVLILAAFVLHPEFRITAPRRPFLGGMLLGLAFVLRPHLAPAIAIIGLWYPFAMLRRQVPAMIGGAAVVLLMASLLDWATLGAPLASIWRYTLYNVFYHVSEYYGVEPWWYYGAAEFTLWQLALAPLLFLLWFGAKEVPMLFVAALAYLAVHSGLAHKEYRFIYPAILLLSIVAAVGLASFTAGPVAVFRRWMPESRARAFSAAALIIAWCLLALGVWTDEPLAKLRLRGQGTVLAASFVSHRADVCGIGLFGFAGEDWGVYGGYTYLHHPISMYWPKDETELASRAPGFNILLSTEAPPPGLGFSQDKCFGKTPVICAWHRPGGCSPAPMARLPMTPKLVGLVGD